MGMLVLTLTAVVSALHSPECTAGMFGLLVMGATGIRPCMLASGADQFNRKMGKLLIGVAKVVAAAFKKLPEMNHFSAVSTTKARIAYTHWFRFVFLLVAMFGYCDAQPKNIFLLAGQSNMVGYGGTLNSSNNSTEWDRVIPPESKSNPSIFRLESNLTWEEAHEPLHHGIDHRCSKQCGVGPGMPFANTLLNLRPSIESIGLVPCAVSGSSLASWMKETSGSSGYYTNLINRAQASTRGGGVLRALLWFQGEIDAGNITDAKSYGDRFEEFLINVRKDLSAPTLPIILVAIVSGGTNELRETVRDQQKGMRLRDPHAQCVDAMGSQLEPDNLHLTTPSQVLVGEKMAHAFINCTEY